MNLSPVDFHCHLDLYPEFPSVLADCEEQQIFTLAVTTTPRAWPRNHELASQTKYVRAALGLHPQVVVDYSHEFDLWEKYLPQARYVGEVGLDAGPRFYSSFELQKSVFERVLRACAVASGKILSVHSVRSAKVVLDMIESHLPRSRGRVVLHWFTGTAIEARRAAELGCYFSVNSEMFKNERHAKLIAALPSNRILTETDGPFTNQGDITRRPRDISCVLAELARVRQSTSAKMAELVNGNLRGLVSEGTDFPCR